jgi:hypothetical protein
VWSECNILRSGNDIQHGKNKMKPIFRSRDRSVVVVVIIVVSETLILHCGNSGKR